MKLNKKKIKIIVITTIFFIIFLQFYYNTYPVRYGKWAIKFMNGEYGESYINKKTIFQDFFDFSKKNQVAK